MIRGVGVDIIEVARISKALDRYGERFVRRVFAQEEADVCQARAQRGPCFAARFAAKEAVMKALGCGWGPVGWRDIVVERAANGQPRVRLAGRAAILAKEQGVQRIYISLAHVAPMATAYAIAWGGLERPISSTDEALGRADAADGQGQG